MSAQVSVGGVSIRSRNGASSRKGGVFNGQMTKASDKRVRPPLPPLAPPSRPLHPLLPVLPPPRPSPFAITLGTLRVACRDQLRLVPVPRRHEAVRRFAPATLQYILPPFLHIAAGWSQYRLYSEQ